jgi:uracil-DNA glycosylase family 4
MEKIFEMARDKVSNLKKSPNTFSGALFSNHPNFFKKVEEKPQAPTVKVVFIGAEFEEDKGQSRELLNKMIQAMKLSNDEYSILEIEVEKKEKLEDIKSQILAEKPSVVVTLGAFASNLLLEGQERLSKIHGNFFPRSFSDNFHTQIVPLFHPSFLLINPGMKKSAWMDMQKIMDFLGKPLA